MFETIGVPELLIVLVIVVLLFGAGRVGRLGKDLGTSVKEFRRAMKDEDGDISTTTVNVAPVAQIAAPGATETDAPAPSQAQAVGAPQIF
jgi:sec-independent protein translocase protein TatA